MPKRIRQKLTKSPMALTLALLRRREYKYQIVETTIPKTFIKRDLFGCIDVLVMTDEHTIGIQVTSLDNLAARTRKAMESELMIAWLRNPGRRFVLHGWRKLDRNHTCKERELRLASDGSIEVMEE